MLTEKADMRGWKMKNSETRPISRFNRMYQFTRYDLLADFFFHWCSVDWKSVRLKRIHSTAPYFSKSANCRPLTYSFQSVSNFAKSDQLFGTFKQ